jgi:hypothetical protein
VLTYRKVPPRRICATKSAGEALNTAKGIIGYTPLSLSRAWCNCVAAGERLYALDACTQIENGRCHVGSI